jgi:hypothetical protein
MAEYATMASGLELKKELFTLPLDEFNKQLTVAIGKVINDMAKGTKTFQGGNWAILSHAATLVENRLLITVLLRR